MRCLECDYSLWNLKARQCPECGTAFTPRAYEFVPNSVRFCCPHCDQPYYGTGPTGLLEPDAFDCVKCGRHVTLDEMVLLPAEGLTEHQTRIGVNPWLERSRTGRFKGWWSTITQSLVSPNRLAQGTPESSSLVDAWRFAIITWAATFTVSIIPAMCIALGMPMLVPQAQQGGGPTPALITALMAGGTVAGILFAFVFMVVFTWIWSLVTHALLRIGGSPGPLRVTMQSLLYSSGTIVISIIPCIGNLAMIWWIVSAVMMIKEAHDVSGVRATFAVLTGPVVMLAVLIVSYVVLIAAAFAGMGATTTVMPAQTSTQSTQLLAQEIVEYARRHGGVGPAHALQLVMDPAVTESDFVDPLTATALVDVPVADVDLLDLSLMAPDDRPAVIEQAAAGLPADVVAYRVGDFVFTYHGAVLDGRAPGLWVVVMSPDPDTAQLSRFEPRIVVGRADGLLLQILPERFPAWLRDQNTLRAEQGLPPLPDPRNIRHDAPAVADPGGGYDPD